MSQITKAKLYLLQFICNGNQLLILLICEDEDECLPVSAVLGERRLVVAVTAPENIHLNRRSVEGTSVTVFLAVRERFVPIDNDGIDLAFRTLINNLYTTARASTTTATYTANYATAATTTLVPFATYRLY